MDRKFTSLAKDYYDLIKKLALPTRNQTTLKKKIVDMKEEVGEIKAKEYIAKLDKEYKLEDDPFEPVLTSADDIYNKRLQFENYWKRNEKPEKVRRWL